MECTGSVSEVRDHIQLSIDLPLSLSYFALKASSHLVTGIVRDFLHNLHLVRQEDSLFNTKDFAVAKVRLYFAIERLLLKKS